MRQLGIRAIPAGPRAATQADPLGLTWREREVLELICTGLTNAQIATKLFISPKDRRPPRLWSRPVITLAECLVAAGELGAMVRSSAGWIQPR